MTSIQAIAPQRFIRFSILPVAFSVLLLGGCASVQQRPLASEEIVADGLSEVKKLGEEIEPLAGPLTLEDAIARAIKYNLDRRVKLMEESVARGQWDTGRFDLLPKLVASAGYHERNNDLITKSKDSVTGVPSLANPYISSDRNSTGIDLGVTWSLLDFGQSYYAERVSSERIQIAGERRRKALHLLIQDVRSAFWRAASAQKLRQTVQKTIAEGDEALNLARQAEAERLRNPLESLRYQRQLLENLRLLETVEQELSSARVELASLTRLPLGQDMVVAEPKQEMALWWQNVPVEKMEQLAIAQNADLRESIHNTRIATDEARRGLLRLFPNLTFNYGAHQSNDSYLINQNWNDAGLQLSFNLFNLLGMSAQEKLGEAGIELAKQQRLATTMGVLAQVHLARQQLSNVHRQYVRADSIWKVDLAISEQIANREQAQTQTKLDRIANQTSAILSELRRYQALANLQAAASRLQATLGVEPKIEGSSEMRLAELTAVVANALRTWDEGRFEGVASDTPSKP